MKPRSYTAGGFALLAAAALFFQLCFAYYGIVDQSGTDAPVGFIGFILNVFLIVIQYILQQSALALGSEFSDDSKSRFRKYSKYALTVSGVLLATQTLTIFS